MRSTMPIFALLLLAAGGLRADDINTKAFDYETASQQIGGKGGTGYSAQGVLRCNQPSHVIMAIRIRKGTVIDMLQVGCAPVQKTPAGLGWTQENSYWGAAAGNTSGGTPRVASCPNTWAVVGFKAMYAGDNDYLEDIRIECAPIVAVKNIPSTWRRGGLLHPVRVAITDSINRKPVKMYFEDAFLQSQLGVRVAKEAPDLIGTRQGPNQIIAHPPSSYCSEAAASGLAVGVGKWVSLAGLAGLFDLNPNTGPPDVVQAFRLYCAGLTVDAVLVGK